MLTGFLPFNGKTDKEIIKKVRMGEIDFSIKQIEQLSEEAQNFLKELLQYNPRRRISAENAVNHPWIKLWVAENDNTATLLALRNLSNFNTRQKLQEAVVTFIVVQLMEREELIDLENAFKMLDVDNNGKLGKEELTNGYFRIFGNMKLANQHVDKIFSSVDRDASGEIDYSEWLVATIDKEKLLTMDKLTAAFNLFDKDGGGTISAQEVKNELCGATGGDPAAQDDEIWAKIISEVDNDGNGELDFQEFSYMMNRLLDDPKSTNL